MSAGIDIARTFGKEIMLPKLTIIFAAMGMLCGCATPKAVVSAQAGVSEEEPTVGKVEEGPWNNIYRGDPSLAGVIVQQFPDGYDDFTFEERNGKHPCMILYGFWEDRFRHVEYTPSGKVTGDFWFEIDDSTKWIWDNVDFTQGSDPSFKMHQDPRARWDNASKSSAESGRR